MNIAARNVERFGDPTQHLPPAGNARNSKGVMLFDCGMRPEGRNYGEWPCELRRDWKRYRLCRYDGADADPDQSAGRSDQG